MPATTRRSLLSLIGGWSIFRPAPAAAPDAFTLAPSFKEGQLHRYSFNIEQHRDGRCALLCDMDVALEVMARSADGWRMRWCVTRFVLHDALPELRPLLEEMGRLTEGMPIDFLVSDGGGIRGFADVSTLRTDFRARAQRAFEAAVAAGPQDPLWPRLRPVIETLLHQESVLDQTLLKEARMLLGAMGRDYRVGEALEVRTQVPSLLGSGEIPVLGRFSVRSADARRGEAELGWLMVLDTRAAASVVMREVAALAPQPLPSNPWAARGAGPLPHASNVVLDFDDRADFTIDLATAWPRRGEHRRRVAAGGKERRERVTWSRQPD